MTSRYDVVVIGAGPAGSVAAYALARHGIRVLLVDKTSFPRDKVCGCCLNMQALAVMDRLGLGSLPGRLGACPLSTLRLSYGPHSASIGLLCGRSLSRRALDHALIEHARNAGVRFMDLTRATLGSVGPDTRRVVLHQQGESPKEIESHIVLIADGLAGTARSEGIMPRCKVFSGSRMGVGLVLEQAPAAYEPSVIYMACGRKGYAGLVRLEDGRLDVAAALDVAHTRSTGGPGPVVESLLRDAGFPSIDALPQRVWRGTSRLTRSCSRVWDTRVFVLGDAAGYVEPFTGEGMAWAMSSAEAVTEFALAGCGDWSDDLGHAWQSCYRRTIRHRQLGCRLMSSLLRRPMLAGVAIRLLSRSPQLSSPILRLVNQAVPC